MCLMKYGLNLPFWGKFSEKFLENRLQWICSFETLELGVGVKQIFQIPVGALDLILVLIFYGIGFTKS